MKPKGLTKHYEGISLFLEAQLWITNPQRNTSLRCMGLWDTGASRSMVSQQAASQLELKILGIATVEGFHGEDFRPFYDVTLSLDQGLAFHRLRVVGAQSLAGRDFLLGMDIISQLDFAVTNVGGNTVHSIRFPSQEVIDFEAQ